MSPSAAASARVWPWLFPVLLAALLAGCATEKIDWPSRIGTYTYDQAVLDLGPPDKWAKLQDGAIVAEWLTARGYSYVATGVGFGYPYWYGPYYPTYVTSAPDYFLRLTFDPNGKLTAWKRFSR
jgi:hypothetical protein